MPHQWQHLLEQSLREVSGNSVSLSSDQEQELHHALRELSTRLQHILGSSHLSNSSSLSEQTLPLVPASNAAQAANFGGTFQLVTSREGILLTASELACEVLELDLARLGVLSLGDIIPRKEWKIFLQHLQASEPPTSHEWVATMPTHWSTSQQMHCSVLPLFDHRHQVSSWMWNVTPTTHGFLLRPVTQLIQNLEARLVAGESVEECLTRICEGLVNTFGFSFVWVASQHEPGSLSLSAHAEQAGLDWEAHGPPWVKNFPGSEVLAALHSNPHGFYVSPQEQTSHLLPWVPMGFGVPKCVVMPLVRAGEVGGVLVAGLGMSAWADESLLSWLQTLSVQIAELIECGKRLTYMRLQSAALDSVTYAVCVTDSQGKLQWVNDAYSVLRGVPIYQLLGTPLPTFPRDQIHELQMPAGSMASRVNCVRTEIMEHQGGNGEGMTVEQVVTPLMNEQGTITHFVAILQDITAQKTVEAQMRHQAYHDALTDLPNRIMFEDRLQQAVAQARRQGNLLAVLFLDLDNFKPINDQYGHKMGDRLLRVVAKRLVSCVRATDTVARLSGDEFTMILQGLDRIRDVRQVARKILDCLVHPIRLHGQDVAIQTSIGIAVYPKDSTQPHQLLEIADHAMYQAKEQGGQQWVFATEEWNFE